MRVEDASGTQFVVYEFGGGWFLIRQSRFELDTGEPLEIIDDRTFEIVTTGECLVRV